MNDFLQPMRRQDFFGISGLLDFGWYPIHQFPGFPLVLHTSAQLCREALFVHLKQVHLLLSASEQPTAS